MMDFGFYNMDCMEGMKKFPDKYFDLAIVDPPYGGVTRGGTCQTLPRCLLETKTIIFRFGIWINRIRNILQS